MQPASLQLEYKRCTKTILLNSMTFTIQGVIQRLQKRIVQIFRPVTIVEISAVSLRWKYSIYDSMSLSETQFSNYHYFPREARLLAIACAPAGLFGLQFLKERKGGKYFFLFNQPWIIPWIVAAHFVPGSENLSANCLVTRARELSRLVNVLKVPAMSKSMNRTQEDFQTCPRQPGSGTPCCIQDTASPFQETHKATSWSSFHCPHPVSNHLPCCKCQRSHLKRSPALWRTSFVRFFALLHLVFKSQ